MFITFLPWFVQLLNTDVMVKQSRIQNIVTETDLIGTCVIVALSNSLRRENHCFKIDDEWQKMEDLVLKLS